DSFRGRPKPTVVGSGLEEQELLERLEAPPGGRRGPELLPPFLGYRGVIVERVPAEATRGRARRRAGRGKTAAEVPFATPTRIAGGVVYGPRHGRPAGDPFVDDFICGSTGPFRRAGLDKRFFDKCPEEIDRFRRTLE